MSIINSTGQDKKVSRAGNQLPAQLSEFRFVKLKQGGKIPVEKWGPDGKTYSYGDPELLNWISQGGNYGVIAGLDHVIIACDYPLIERAVESRLPPTFAVKSPRHKTKHFYYRVDKPLMHAITCIPGEAGDPIADIRHGNGFVVGPGSRLEGYGAYEVVDDRPIAAITESELLKALGEFVRARGTAENTAPAETHGFDLPIVKVLEVLGATNLDWTGTELVGPHPAHGSTGGHNFHVNVEKNAWHCFRAGHESGGGPLELLAVMMGLVACEDCKKPSPLKTDKELFKAVLAEAKKLGLVKENKAKAADTPKQAGGSQDEKSLFNLAKQIVADTPIVTDIRTYLMLRWNGKAWVDDAEGIIHKKLVEVHGENYKPYHLTTLTQLVQGLTFNDRLEEPPPYLINFKNGVLNLNTMELTEHSPAFYFRNCINADYDPNADCPKFKAWLAEVLPDPASQACVQELFGYCFLRDYPIHKLIFLVGTGRNGKGALVRTLQGLLGSNAVASVPIHRLAERFQVANLIGKLVNVDSEPRLSVLNTAIVKQLTGQDLMSAELKGKQKQLQFTNYAKIIILANKLPPVHDNTVAWWERVVIIEFPNEFTGEKQKVNIQDSWLCDENERNGIARWALEGLQRLIRNGKFTQSKQMEELKEEYKRWSDPVGYFVARRCEFSPKLWIGKAELYNAYKEFAEDENLPIVREELFGAEIKKLPRVRTERKRIQGGLSRVWVGIGLKSSAGGDPSDPSDPRDYILRKISGLNKEDKVEDKEFFKSIEVPGSLGSPGSVRGAVDKKAEICANCQEYLPDYQLCTLDGECRDPGSSCSEFQPKPPPTPKHCYASEWGEPLDAAATLQGGHFEPHEDEPDHEIEEGP